MGNKTEFKTRNGKRDDTRYIIFNEKRETAEKTEKTGGKKNLKKNGNKTGRKTGEKKEKTGKNRKKQEKTGKTENYKKYRNKILTRFREMVKTETSFWQDFGKR